MFVIV